MSALDLHDRPGNGQSHCTRPILTGTQVQKWEVPAWQARVIGVQNLRSNQGRPLARRCGRWRRMARLSREPIRLLIRTMMPPRPPVLLPARRHAHPWRKRLLWAVAVVGLAIGGYCLFPSWKRCSNTVSTDDAYVNGHVTFVAPRVAGQVSRVLVDDNYRVKKGALLVQLDKEPYQVQVAIKQAAVAAAEADLAAAQAQVRGLVAQARANRWQLKHAIEDVNNQIANLRANVATYKSKKATLELAQANLKRGEELAPSGGISKEDLDQRRQTVKVDEAAVEQALQQVYATRVGLGLPAQPPTGHDLTEVPPDLDQTFSARPPGAGQLGPERGPARLLPLAFVERRPRSRPSPTSASRTPTGDLDRILDQTHSRTRRPSSRPRPSSSRPAATWIRPS